VYLPFPFFAITANPALLVLFIIWIVIREWGGMFWPERTLIYLETVRKEEPSRLWNCTK